MHAAWCWSPRVCSNHNNSRAETPSLRHSQVLVGHSWLTRHKRKELKRQVDGAILLSFKRIQTTRGRGARASACRHKEG